MFDLKRSKKDILLRFKLKKCILSKKLAYYLNDIVSEC